MKANLAHGKTPIVVILGMHRSGTSLVAKFMNAVGVELGRDLMPADQWNAAGYFESLKVVDIHNKILKELNCNWRNPPLSIPDECWEKPAVRALKNDLVEFVRSECSKTDLWGFKDPRSAVLLPLWREVFDELQLEPLYVLTVRHPGSVAASLARRDRLALVHSQTLWLKTYLYALAQTRNHPVAIVDYDRWFESGLEQARTAMETLKLAQSIGAERIGSAVNQTIEPGLRHHASSPDEIYSPVVSRFYALLRQASTDGKVPDEIWTLTEAFNKSADLLSIWDDLVAELDTRVAENSLTIHQNDDQIRRFKKRYKRYKRILFCSYAVLLIMAIVYLTYSLR